MELNKNGTGGDKQTKNMNQKEDKIKITAAAKNIEQVHLQFCKRGSEGSDTFPAVQRTNVTEPTPGVVVVSELVSV